jgi:hypothetical protein
MSSPAWGGRLVVLAMFALAAAASTFAWWWNFNRGRQALKLYGPQAATLIRTAPHVELLAPGASSAIDISHAPGLLNARTSLLNDASYDWKRPITMLASPQDTLRFTDGSRSVEITFDFDNHALKTSSTGRTAVLNARTSTGWKTYLERQAKNRNTDRHESALRGEEKDTSLD